MKVAAVFYSLEPRGGGVHTFAGTLFDAIRAAEADSQHSFVFYSAGGATPPAGVKQIPATRVARSRKRAIDSWRGRAGAALPRLRTWLERSLDDEQVDIVWFATNYAEECNRPFVLTVFDIEHARQPWFPEVSRAGEWERREAHYSRYVPKATRVIVPNAVGRAQLERYYAIESDRILCLPHPTPRFALDAGARPPLPRDRVDALGVGERYVFYPAQFWAHKNHLVLFEALAELGSDREYELVLVGSDKGQLAHTRSLASKKGVSDRVHFLGFVQTDDLIALYQHAHALTYASVFGPENLPPLEAMALGCPVIAADIPGAREQMGNAALLAPAADSVAWAQAIRQLEDTSLRATLAAAGRERAAYATAERYVSGVLEFFDDFERLARSWC